jgi:hypothetical protein
MTPISKSLIVYKGITFDFFVILRQDVSLIGTFTANPSNDRITSSVDHGLTSGDLVNFIPGADGVLPSPIEARKDYFVLNVNTSTQFQISAEYNGALFEINTAGSGTNNLWTNRPFDLTGWKVWAWVKQTPGGTLIQDLNPQIDADPTLGKITMGMTDEETFGLTTGDFFWDMIFEDPSGVRLGPLFAGSFTIAQLITEPAEA